MGWELQRSLAPLGSVVALGSRSRELCGDFNDLEGIAKTVSAVRPDVIVNAAAYTAVDKAESEASVAMTVNALAPGVIARAAQAVGAFCIHYSTDYVFDGSGESPWREGDATGPLNVYGATKLEGERLLALHCQRHLIMRTSWVYSSRGNNFAKTMLRLAGERSHLTVINDQVGAPTGADLLADVTAHAVPALLADSRKAGVYHVAAAGEATWHSYASFVIGAASEKGVPLQCEPAGIEPVPSSAFKTAARRPANSRLDTTRFRETFELTLPPWQQGVARMLDETT